MRLLNALKNKKSLKWGIIAAIVVSIILPVIQTGFFQNSFQAWFLTLIKSPLNSSLYIVFSLLFGGLISLQIYNLNRKVCDVEVFDKPRTSVRGTLRASKSPEQTQELFDDCNSKKGYGTGAIGLVFGTLVGICPACIGLIGLILPLGGAIWLTYYGWVFMLIAIAIMMLSIYLLGGFKKE